MANGSDRDLQSAFAETPIETYVDALFALAVKKRASDIHLEPQNAELCVRLRVDGLLHRIASPPSAVADKLCARIKVMAAMNIAERRLPQDGRISVNNRGHMLDLRISTLPTIWGEKLVLRLVPDSGSILQIDQLGLAISQVQDLFTALSQPQGLILITGPTGSGKTLTLYSALQWLNAQHRNIATAEEPVEIPLAGVNQVAIKPRIGLNFAETLRALLRQDPDVLMVGEIRDADTAAMAIRAAQTGHLILSSVHTKSAQATMLRLHQLGVSRRDLHESVTLIMAQRLLRRLCPHCRQVASAACPLTHPHTCYAANSAGCSRCSGVYWGRLGIFELARTEHLNAASAVPADNDVSRQARCPSMLREQALKRHLAGETCWQELNRIVPNELSNRPV
tara:strand:- start:1237 stop:2421 length:1185 start_codon:yes stop_codon:yes gene_type:complete